ncbi:MAG TPA: alpha/beta hydrolase [Planctomycetota bacterium]|nr:alpha/beta hydrolase [Planctomycetota bacterium]
MKQCLLTLICTATVTLAAAEALENKKTMKLWPDKAPGALGDSPADTPTLQVFLPAEGTATGSAMIVCPGGGYGGLAGHEGPTIGEWFAKNGITAFVLRYRLGPKYNHPIELGDAQRAIRFVRAQAADWKLDPNRIGILGFSAGGHLASTAATHYDEGKPDAADPIDKVSCRPNAQILIYPVVTMGPGTHAGSKSNLLGKNPSQELIDLLSNEKHVNDKTPPAFVVHSTKDTVVPVSNSDNYVEALKKAGVPHEYIRGEFGNHGFGLNAVWDAKCIAWLRGLKF